MDIDAILDELGYGDDAGAASPAILLHTPPDVKARIQKPHNTSALRACLFSFLPYLYIMRVAKARLLVAFRTV